MILHAISKEQLRSVLAAARARRERDWIMILVAYWHGLRASEVIAIKRDDIRDGQLTVRRLKGSLRTTHPLIEHSDPLFSERQTLIDFAAKMRANQRLFPITRQQFGRLFKRYSTAAGIAARLSHPHVLKHSIALHAIENAGIENVRQYLGHKSIASTGAYLRVSDEAASDAVIRALRL